MDNLWWGKIRTSEQAEKIIYHSSNFSFFLAGILVIYGALYGVMAPGFTYLTFGLPDGGLIGTLPGVLYASLTLFLRQFKSQLAALMMSLFICVLLIDNSVYHYLPVGTIPIMLILLINLRSIRATFAWHRLRKREVSIEEQGPKTRILNLLPWYGVIGALSLIVSLPNIVWLIKIEQRMRPYQVAPCTILGKHENPPSIIIGGGTTYSVSCRFQNWQGKEEVTSSSISKEQWETLQVQQQISVQYHTRPPYYNRIQITEYDWVAPIARHCAIGITGFVLFVLGLVKARNDKRLWASVPKTERQKFSWTQIAPNYLKYLRTVKGGVISGVVYGIVLVRLALFSDGVGQGYITLSLSSPLSAFAGTWVVAIWSGPLMWAAMGLLLAKSDRSPYRKVFLVAMALYYMVGIRLVTGTEFADWKHFGNAMGTMPPFLLFWVVIYVVGQGFIWRAYLKD